MGHPIASEEKASPFEERLFWWSLSRNSALYAPLGEEALDLFFDYVLGDVAYDLVGDFAALEEQEGGNAADAVTRGRAPFWSTLTLATLSLPA